MDICEAWYWIVNKIHEKRIVYSLLPEPRILERLFWFFAATHLILWTLVPALSSPNAPLDTIEGFVWGREWLIGTYKHPPMQAWVLEIFGAMTGGAHIAPFFASALAVVIAFWAVWKTGKRIADPRTALVGVMLLEGAVYYNFTSPEFNPNVLQLPFWALAALSFHRAVKENRWYDWVLLGLWGVGGLYTKYSTALLLVALALALVTHRQGRARLKGLGPYLTLTVLGGLYLPHLYWLWDHQFLPFTYADSRTDRALHFYQRLTFPVEFLAAQALSLLPLLLLYLVFARGRFGMRRGQSSFDHHFLNAVALWPAGLILLASMFMGFRPRDMWGACLWNFFGLWLVVHSATYIGEACALRRFAKAWVFVFMLGIASLAVSNNVYPYAKGKALRIHYPGHEIAQTIEAAWHERFDKPLAFEPVPLVNVMGDTWLAGNIAYYSSESFGERPHVIVDGNYAITTWADRDKVWEQGGVLVWSVSPSRILFNVGRIPPYLFQMYPGALVQKPLIFSQHTKASLPPVIVGWAIVPPRAPWSKDYNPLPVLEPCLNSWCQPY